MNSFQVVLPALAVKGANVGCLKHAKERITESLANNSGFRSVLSKLKFICKFCLESATA